jgi:hypothetical protein
MECTFFRLFSSFYVSVLLILTNSDDSMFGKIIFLGLFAEVKNAMANHEARFMKSNRYLVQNSSQETLYVRTVYNMELTYN